ncbi:MAG: YfiR family protein [Sphingopyxis sp.]|nr:YfiR family protein [Sphingopyxis sp.]
MPSVAALSLPIALLLQTAQPAVQTAVPEGPDAAAVAAADMVEAIVAYSRWPTRTSPVTLCIAAPSPLTARIGAGTLGDGRRTVTERYATATLPAPGCDVLILGGAASIAEQQRIARASSGQPLLTISFADPMCRTGMMACIRESDAGMLFDLNLDAVARSEVRLDPRVLAIGRRRARP